MSRKNFQEWEKDFIKLAYPLSKAKDIASILNRNEDVIKNKAISFNLQKIKNHPEINDKFVKLTVRKFIKIDKYGSKVWLCECDCGKYTKCTSNTLNRGHSTSCGCGRIEAISKSGKHISGSIFGKIKNGAKQRNLEFDLDLEFLDSLLEKQNFKCALSGLELIPQMGRITKENTISLDRIDNTKGYTRNNVQWLHKHVNYMKWTHDQNYLLLLCEKIYKNNQGIK